MGPYQIYTPLSYNTEHRHSSYRTGKKKWSKITSVRCVSFFGNSPGYSLNSISSEVDTRHLGTPYVRVVKRRSTANKKERRRTQSINNAYADLRDCIPNVPADTKLSKVSKNVSLTFNCNLIRHQTLSKASTTVNLTHNCHLF